jgi:manganese transport protein
VTAAGPDPGGELDRVRQGLRLQAPPDPRQLAAEAAWLSELDRGPFLRRLRGWLSLSGPGYLQSALTLGAGTATSSLFAGAMFGYELLWVAPLGMLLGVVVLAAVAHQTLSTGARPLPAMARHAGRGFAWAWAAGSLVASIVWHVPQYVLAAGAVDDLGQAVGMPALPPLVPSLVVFAAAVAATTCYGRSPALVRAYERVLKWMVWAIVLCLLWVVVHTDTDWGAVAKGFVPHLPADRHGQSATTLAVSGLGAAVGINMVFLYPYSLLARGWGRAHRGLARCDLLLGMWLPYTLATSQMVIAAANTIGQAGAPVGKGATIAQVGGVLGQVLGPLAGRVVFDLGMLAMAFSTISLHMVVCGFVASEWFGCAVGSRAHRLWSLLPAPACLAPVVLPMFGLQGLPPWVGVPTNIACLGLLPLCCLAFLLLQRNRSYLGADRPTGLRLLGWTLAIGLAITVLAVGFVAGVRDLLR